MDPIKLKHLLTRIVNSNDEKAYSEFFDHYYTRLMNLAMIYLPQYSLAEEVVSDVIYKILLKKSELQDIKNFEGYLFKMVKNHSLNALRLKKNKSSIVIDDIQDHLTTDFIDPDKKLINDNLKQRLNQAIQMLPPKRRLVFKMIKDEGMSYKETAEILELSHRTVEVHLKLAIQNLRTVLDSFYKEHVNDIPVSKQIFMSIFL